jgi:FtsH-binding integral membrane protein
MENDILYSPEQIALTQQRFITKVYGLMAAALAITGLVSFYTISNEEVLTFAVNNRLILIIAELLLVVSLSGLIQRMSAPVATLIFVIYSALNGLTLSMLFLVYTAASLASTFFITAGLFAIMAAYGYFTQKDLTRFGSLLFMLLIGLVLASLVNLFMRSETIYWISTYVGIFIFTGLVAYDTQRLKEFATAGIDGEAEQKVAIYGALRLYLDFINLFIMLLRIFGRRR